MDQRNSTQSLEGTAQKRDECMTASSSRKPAPLRTDLGKRPSAIKAQQTTPGTTFNAQIVPQQRTGDAVFHNYLRAFCHFEPPTNADENEEALLLTTRIRPGDLILVHSVHANGWADGTVLSSGARGWLPTNYCETFDHPYMRNLLNAMTQCWDLLGTNEGANLSTFVRQEYIRPLIAGVRYLLEHSDCLHRDASLVQRSTGIRRLRKGLLADLSTLVQISRRLQETIGEPYAGEVIHVLLDDLMAKAFKVVTRAVAFIDVLAQEGAGVKPLGVGKRRGQDQSTSPATENGDAPASSPNDSAKHFQTDSSVSYSSVEAAMEGKFPRFSQDTRLSRASVARPLSGQVSHRLSMVKRDRAQPGTLASEQLAQAHDLCISHIGSFIGLLLHSSRPASELIATTDSLVSACLAMLSIVENVSAYELQNKTTVQQAQNSYQLKLDDLVSSTEDVVKHTEHPDDDIVMLPEQTSHLVEVGTSLIRTVGDCVVKTRRVIEQVGDFDLEDPPVTEAENDPVDDAAAGAESRDVQEQPPDPPPAAIQNEGCTSTTRTVPLLSRPRAKTTTDVIDIGASTSDAANSKNAVSATSHYSLPVPPRAGTGIPQIAAPTVAELKITDIPRKQSTSPDGIWNMATSIADSTETQQSSMRDSGLTLASDGSTRPTTPDHNRDSNVQSLGVMDSFDSRSSLRSANTEDSNEAEAQLLQKSFANELTLNKEGQVTGGSLRALVEQLTTGDCAPDPQFTVAFFLTFRCFATPRELAQALIHRYDYIGDSKSFGTPVRLRTHNVFKGWLETYWNAEADRDALGDIRFFAIHKLKPTMPSAGERLVDLIRKVGALYQAGTITGPLVSGVGKTSMSIAEQHNIEREAPEPIISKSQLNTLRNILAGGSASCSIVDFDPLELARQMTLLASNIFCEIQPEELLSLDWNKKDSSKAQNVKAICSLNTDVAHVVGDTVLTPDDAKKRALVIKQWSKVAQRCLELNNYETVMAIMCSLNSSVVLRLKRTWEAVGKKTRARLEELNSVIDFSKNQASLRRRLETPVVPCLPFLGVYLTDLTMVDAGNPKLRELPGAVSETGETFSVINFDKHMRMAKIVSHIQKFQMPYKLKAVPELQDWMHLHLDRMREGQAQMVGNFHRRSLVIEPKREFHSNAQKTSETRRVTEPHIPGDIGIGERPKTAGSTQATIKSIKPHGQTFDFILKTNFTFKSRSEVPQTPTDCAEEK